MEKYFSQTYSSMNQVGLEVLVLEKMDISFQNSNLGDKRKMDFCLCYEGSDPGTLVASVKAFSFISTAYLPEGFQEAYAEYSCTMIHLELFL